MALILYKSPELIGGSFKKDKKTVFSRFYEKEKEWPAIYLERQSKWVNQLELLDQLIVDRWITQSDVERFLKQFLANSKQKSFYDSFVEWQQKHSPCKYMDRRKTWSPELGNEDQESSAVVAIKKEAELMHRRQLNKPMDKRRESAPDLGHQPVKGDEIQGDLWAKRVSLSSPRPSTSVMGEAT